MGSGRRGGLVADAVGSGELTPSRASDLLDRRTAALVLAACVVVPLIFTISLEDTFVLPKVVALSAVLLVALALTVAGRRARPRSAPGALAIGVGAFAILNGVAAIFSRDPRQSLVGEPLQYQGLLTVALYVGSFWVARRALGEDRRAALLFGAIGAGAVLVSAYALVQWAGLDPLWGRPLDGRVFSTIGQPNALAAYLAMAVPVTASLLPRLSRRVRPLVLLGVAAMIMALASTLSRAGYLALVVAGAILLPPILRALRVPLRRVATGAIGAALVVVVAASVAAPVRDLASGVWDRARSVVDVEEDVSIRSHLALWAVGWRIALDHPLLGAGQETFPELYPLYRRHVLGAERARPLSGFRPESPHNVYLALAGGAGFPALLAYLAVIAGFFLLVARALQRTASPPERVLLFGALAAVAAHLLTDAFMTAEVTGSWLFWTVLGATAGLASTPAAAGTESPNRPPRVPDPSGTWQDGTVAEVLVPGFLPSTAGFRFPNRFPRVPVRRIGIPGLVEVPIGDASNGLCGGMAYAARDYFEARRPPPPETEPPAEDSPMYRYIVRRLFDSFSLPWGPARYLELMNPALPDGDGLLARLGILPHGRAWRMIREEWLKIRADIDAGHPSPLGLVRIKSANPFDLKYNHQVLAYGYEVAGDLLTLRLYDPNRPGDDGIMLSLRLGDPRRPAAVTSTVSGRETIAFFRTDYRPVTPP